MTTARSALLERPRPTDAEDDPFRVTHHGPAPAVVLDHPLHPRPEPPQPSDLTVRVEDPQVEVGMHRASSARDHLLQHEARATTGRIREDGVGTPPVPLDIPECVAPERRLARHIGDIERHFEALERRGGRIAHFRSVALSRPASVADPGGCGGRLVRARTGW